MTQFDQTLKFDRAGAGAVGLSQALGDASADKRLEVLRRVAETGSYRRQPARWTSATRRRGRPSDMLTNLAGEPLVDRTVGGSGGGGARRPAGPAIAGAGRRTAAGPRGGAGPFCRESAGRRRPGPADQHAQPAALPGSSRCRRMGPATPPFGCGYARPGAARLVAQITRESADLLGLAPGLPVLALCKATAVRIATGTDPTGGEEPGGGAAPMLSGRVERASAGHSHDEITLALPAGGAGWVLRRTRVPPPWGTGPGLAMAPSSMVLAR